MKLRWRAARVLCVACASSSPPLKGKKSVKDWIEAHAKEDRSNLSARVPVFEITIGAGA